MRRFTLLLSVVGLVTALFAPAASAATPSCGITWGSLPKSGLSTGEGDLGGVRTGRHACYDRVVIDVEGAEPGYLVGYVPQVVTDGAGEVVPLRGGAFLEVVAQVEPPGWTVGDEVADVRGSSTLREVAYAGFFEGQVTLGIGTRARLPFRVFTLPGPGTRSRLVIDVAHRW